ncbi:MAG: adenylate/guanylate cyclase domain-containing protein [Acidobacteriota bacterium]|nr:adenylate/guanylate cyclase domain-containing protein [Acidobacteriota bacterium]
MYVLRYTEGGEEKKVEITDRELLLGRAPDCALVLAQPGISRHHCKIMSDGNKVAIADMGSKNGTRVNNIYIKNATLNPGDTITVAEFPLKFEVLRPKAGPVQGRPEEDTDQMVLLTEQKELHEEAGTIIREAGDFKDIIAQYDQEKKAVQAQKSDKDEAKRIMTVIIEVAEALIAVKSLDEIIEKLMDLIFANLPADRGFLMLLNNQGRLEAKVTKHRNADDSEIIEISSTIANKALREQCAILTTDAQVDPRFKAGESIRFLGIKSAMCVPLFHKKKSIGIIYLDCPTSAAVFTPNDLDLLTSMANFAAVGIEQAQLAEKIQEEQSVRERLSRYHSPAIVSRILENLSQSDGHLLAEMRDVSIMFADIVGFTPFSERTSPARIAELLNGYFSEMTDVIFKYEGTLDKYIGDAIMAIFGAPNAMEDHALRAVSAGLEMLERLAVVNQHRPPDYQFKIRIGINSGRAVAGDIGSMKRMEYTVLGNTVNMAARIESMACKPLQVVVGEGTYQAVKDHFICQPLGPIRLKGISEETHVYHIQGKR